MQNRTPTYERLILLARSLDEIVRDIKVNVPFARLDSHAMVEVMKYMGKNFSQVAGDSRTFKPLPSFGLSGDVVFYDIGYRLVKYQLEHDLRMRGNERRLLLDGIMGWLFYNPGTKHQEMMDSRVANYVFIYDAHRLSDNFKTLREMFGQFREQALHADDEVIELKNTKEQAFLNMFSQFFAYGGQKNYLDIRARQIARIVPEIKL